MTHFRFLGILLLMLGTATESARADDICGGPQERQKVTAELQAKAAKAEKAGKPAELFLAYQTIAGEDCASDDLRAKARVSLPKLGRELAAKAEAKGVLYTKDPVRADGQTSAFMWLEAIGDFAAADRVMLKAVRARPEDMELFKVAWNSDTLSGRRSAGKEHYKAPPGYRQELEKVASTNAAKLMALEEKDAAGLSGDVMTLSTSAMKSREKLRLAAAWMQFLPGGDKPAKARAEQRGDAIMKRGDAGLTGATALAYYEWTGSPKASQVKAKGEDLQRAMEKSGEKIKGSIAEKSEADQKKFKKGKADLEKELGF